LQIILGAIQTGLQELQTSASQAGMMSTSLAIGTLEATDMLRMNASDAIVLPNGALTMEIGADRTTISALKELD